MPKSRTKDMQFEYDIKTVQELINLTISGKLNPDPIAQRPSTSSGHKKSQEIAEAVTSNLGVGMVSVRDISKDEALQKIYPGVHYLVIDGGHRTRSFVEVYTNKIKVNGKFFKEMSFEEQSAFLDHKIAFEMITCTSREATKIFRSRNKTTAVNFMEMIMCDDESIICKEVRQRVKHYSEYNNSVHEVFEISKSSDGDWKSECFDGDINPRRKWDEYVFIAILKTLGKGNVDAGQREIENLVKQEYEGKNPVSKRVLETVDRFLQDLRNFRYQRGKKLNGDIFAAFQLVWFALYEQNQEFNIESRYTFMTIFMEAYTRLTGTSDTSYNNKIVEIDDQAVNLKEYIRANTKNFANSHVQRICAEYMLKEMGDKVGVVFRDKKRSLTSKEREEHLAIQKYKCAIDGLPLSLEDSVWGHDTPWAHGGQLEDGAVIRKTHNVNMGSTTLDEYRMILKLREQRKLEKVA
jgi:hypothetical protein